MSAVLPDGAQPWVLYFVWYVNDAVVSEGWGYDSFTYTGSAPGATDEIYYEVYAAPWARSHRDEPGSLQELGAGRV